MRTNLTAVGVLMVLIFGGVSVSGSLIVPSIAHAQLGTETPGTGVGVGDTPGTNVKTLDASAAAGGSCSLLGGGSFFENCIWIPMITWLGSWFLTIGGAFLRLAGTLFDTLIYYVIVNFRGTLETLGIIEAINTGWTVLRDFTNIMIIGIFVFIALSIILGLKEFGQKKLIANVLIIAVLINFSLLFTKIIIDGSNFTALQIYKQMVGTDKANAGLSGTPDLASSFLAPMGISSIWDDTSLITKNVAQRSQSALAGFTFGLVGGLMLLAVGGVLFYGSFLIAARAVLFIFLMLTAALAFATYLVPSLAKGEYGWHAWWRALFNNAVFAPLLMLFLAISLGIINAAGKYKLSCSTQSLQDGTCTNTLGAIIADPQKQLDSGGWMVILIYIIGIGLLFVSFRMASKFAGTISGMNLSGAILSAPFGLALRGAAPIFRATAGKRAMERSMKLDDRLKTERASAAMTGDYSKALKTLEAKAKADKMAKRSFEGLDTKIGQAIGKSVNMPSALMNKVNANYADTVKKAAEHAAKDAANLAVSKEEAQGIAKDKIGSERASQQTALTEQHKAAEELHYAAQAMSKSAQQSANIDSRRAQAQAEEADALKKKIDINADHANKKITTEERAEQLRQQDARIKAARENIGKINEEAKGIDALHAVPELKDRATKARAELDAFTKQLNKDVEVHAKEISQSSQRVVGEAAAHIAEHHKPLLAKIVGDDNFATVARERAGKRLKSADLRKKLELQKEIAAENKADH